MTCGNLLTPCPIRDHHADLMGLISAHEPDPIDAAAEAALTDPEYHRGLEAFDAQLKAVMDPVWDKHYGSHDDDNRPNGNGRCR